MLMDLWHNLVVEKQEKLVTWKKDENFFLIHVNYLLATLKLSVLHE